jgi:hypothetical protein
MIKYHTIILFVYGIQEMHKCYVANFDNRVNKYEELLSQLAQRKIVSQLMVQNQYPEQINQLQRENEELRRYLGLIDNYLDEVLETPGMSDEDIFNLRRDQKDIIEMLDELQKVNGKITSSKEIAKPTNTNLGANTHIHIHPN